MTSHANLGAEPNWGKKKTLVLTFSRNYILYVFDAETCSIRNPEIQQELIDGKMEARERRAIPV
jgi:hypothetical protein